MCGTASVAAAFAKAGYEVVAGDQLYFPCLHAKARLLFQDMNVFNELGMSYGDAINYLNGLPPIKGLFSKEYGEGGKPANGRPPRLYFSEENAGRIDAVRAEVKELRKSGANPMICDLLLHNLILAANQVANISGTYGYFQSRLSSASMKPLTLTASATAPLGRHEVLCGSVFETARVVEVDLLYLDPPYTKRQYAGNYHLPETIAREDTPSPVGDGGLRDWSSLASPFCYRKRALGSIEEVMKLSKARIVVWSYSSDGQVPLNLFQQKLTEFGAVEVRKSNLPRFRSNSGAQGGNVDEYLLICDRRGTNL